MVCFFQSRHRGSNVCLLYTSACDGKYAGCIVIEDEVKEDAPAAIKLLKSSGIRKTVMLTGDADAVGQKVAGRLGLDQAYTELLPACLLYTSRCV